MTDADELEYLINRRSAMQTTLLDYLYADRTNHYDVEDVTTLKENIADIDRQILALREKMDENH